MIESRTVSLSEIDTWRTVALFSAADEVRWSGTGVGFHPFAVDNVRWTNEHTRRIFFDEYAPQNVNGTLAGDYSPLGVTYASADDGSTFGGNELGDPGSWGVDGTEGSVFAGFNGASYAGRFSFASDAKHVAVDVSRTNGSSAGDTFTIEGWRDGVKLESKTVSLDSVDTWRTVTLLTSADEVRVLGDGGGFHPFGLDDLRWTSPDAGLILFDEFAPDNANGPMPAYRYADWGVTFVATDDGSTFGGIELGDPGSWGIDGTNGSIFAGFNGDSYRLDLLFDGIVEQFALDVSRSNGSSEGDLFTIEGYLDGGLVESMTAELTDINTWMPFFIDGQIDMVRLFGSGSGFHPFGIDNLNWLWVERAGSVPEPGTLLLLATAVVAWAARRRPLGRRPA